ncbi:MAG: Guanosine-3',5'-bis(diphosphate) 3'-pyrophosphohydrolase / GTP pyrophosphokinase, (p)ppGpp synthetase II, partial [uncultured Pseudonocardia sp.]
DRRRARPGHFPRPARPRPRGPGPPLGHPPGARPHRAPDDPGAGGGRRAGAGAARGGAPHAAPQGRPGAAAARLRRRRRAARPPEAQVRRPLHHPPARGGHDPRRAGHGHHHAGGGAAARHRRGHRLLPRRPARRVRRGGRPPRRRRHEAGQGRVRHGRGGRDDPQDDRRDGPRPPRPGHQAVRPAAQHAHDALPAAGEAGQEGARDARGDGAAGPPPGHGHGEVGAGGPVLRDPAPQEVLRDRPPGRHPRPVARHLPQAGHRRGHPAAGLRAHRRQGRGPAQALLVDLPEDDRQGPRLRRHPRPRRRPRARRPGARLLRRHGHGARAVAADAGPVQGLHRPAPVRGVPVAAHHGDRAGRQAARGADPHPRHAPHRRVRHRGPLAVQGDPRLPRRRGRRGRRDELDAPAARLAAGGRRPRRLPGEPALRPGHPRDLRVHPQGGRRHPAAGVHPRRLRLRRAHRGRQPVHRQPRERPPGRAGAQARVRRRRRDLHLQGRGRGPQPRLAVVRRLAAGQDEDPAVVRQGAPRGRRRGGQGGHHPRGAPHRHAAAAPGVGGRDGRAGPRAAPPRPGRALRRGRRGPHQRPARRAAARGAARRRRGGRGGAGRALHPVHDPAAAHHRRRGRRRRRRRRGRHRPLHEARPLLHARARRRHPRLRHPRRRHLGAPDRLHQRGRPAQPLGAAGRRRVVGVARVGVPRRHPGRGARPAPAALRRHQGAGRRAGEHPVGVGDDLARPRRRVPVQLRDGRPQAPRARAAGRAQRRGRLRRVPGDERGL